MASEIRVNTFKNRSGLGTVSINDSGASFSGVVTATSFSGDLTGNVTGNLTGNVTGNATGLSGSPTLTGITSISTTNLTVNGNAYPNAGPLSNRNLIINGAMQVAQRGTSSTSNGYQTVDRWINQFSGGAVTQSQQSLSSGDPYNEGFRYFLRLANTTSSTDVASYREIATRIEAQNLAQSGWQYTSSASYITVSFWARSSVEQTYYLNLQSEDGTKQTYPSSFALSAETWTKISKTIPGNSSITINNDNGIGMYLSIIPFYGTNYTDSGVTDNSWNARATGTQLPDMTNTWAGTTNATFDVTGVQLEVGSVATPFEHRSYGDELARCQRYYYRLSADSGRTFCVGYNQNTTVTRNIIHFPVTMRSAPTALEQTGTASNYRILTGTTATSCSAVPTLNSTTVGTGEIQATVASGLTAGQGNCLESNASGTYLGFTAEL